MDDLESILTKIIDQFIELQEWASRPEKSRHPKKIFQTILNLDSNLKAAKHFDREHPLQELSNEVRNLFNTTEFRAILLAAFNWRSAAAKKPEPKKKQAAKHVLNPILRPKPRNETKAKKKPKGAKKSQKTKIISPTRMKFEQENTSKFVQQIIDYVDSIPAETRRQMLAQRLAPKEYVDMFQAGRRQYGSYGSKQ
jgi:tRNA nucleotidyltransferase/poly(A) polymerase